MLQSSRVHIKMFMVSEAETGYICGFEVYTGKDSKHDDAECTKTTSTVMDLLDYKITGQRPSCVF